MNFAETIEAFRGGAFEMDFASISWVQSKSDEPEELRGPGVATQTSTGHIDLKCYAAGSMNVSPFAAFERNMNRRSGELYDDEDHFACEATDYRGSIWRASQSIIAHNQWSIPARAGVVFARRVNLRREQPTRPGPHELTLVVFDQDHEEWRALAYAAQEVVLESSNYAFTLGVFPDRDRQVQLVLRSDQAFPEAFERRVIEALQFVLGASLQIAISESKSGGLHALELRSPARLPQIPHTYPPLNPRQIEHRGDAIELFALYLDYISGFPDEGVWHASTNFLTLARNASGVSLDAWAIGLGVAAEGVANLIEFDEPTDVAPRHADVRAAISQLLEQNKTEPSLRKRIDGMLEGLDKVRVRDRMESLVPLGKVLGDDTKSWSKMRNSAVHTKMITAADLTRTKMQKEIDRVFSGIRLLHSIIFHLIGYEGAFTDYASRDFPETRYPFAVPAPDPADARE